MKVSFRTLLLTVFSTISFHVYSQTSVIDEEGGKTGSMNLFMDVHRMGPGKIKVADVAKAHDKDLAVQDKYGVQFLKYWVDEDKGFIFCLVSAADSGAIRQAHAEAHGLLPQRIYPMTGEVATKLTGNDDLFLDIHFLGAGVTANDVAGAHQKDLATEGKYGVNISNYWLDEKEGVVMCLAEAKDSSALIKTHKEAHGLVPAEVFKVKRGR
jgi:hypothetical protein